MNIDELQQKFNEMRKKKWRTTGSHTAATIAGFWMSADGVGYIAIIYAYQHIYLNADTLLPCGITDDIPFIEEASPYADWPIDAKAYFWDEGASVRYKKHFAGVNADGRPMSWCGGCTSWTVADSDPEPFSWDHAELAEDGE